MNQELNNQQNFNNQPVQPNNTTPPTSKKINLGLIIGGVIGVIVIGIGLFIFINNSIKTNSSEKNNVTGNSKVINCKFDGELVQGAEYVNGQYTYRYKQKRGFDDWRNIDKDGWGVILTDKESTEPVTTKLCTYINDKPVVSMSYMFEESQASSIDLSSFNTSNVTDMVRMFYYSEATSLDLSSFDTSNVTDMGSMFRNSAATTLDLSSFDLSGFIDVDWMFWDCKATKGYARTQEDANILNNSSNKPDGLTFIVK